MKRAVLVLGALGIVLALTNPGVTDYTGWAQQRVLRKAPTGLGPLVSLFPVDKLIESATRRENFLIFSIFTTQISDAVHFTTLGIFSHFLLLQSA